MSLTYVIKVYHMTNSNKSKRIFLLIGDKLLILFAKMFSNKQDSFSNSLYYTQREDLFQSAIFE